MSQKLEVISYELERRFRRNNLILKHSRKISDTANPWGFVSENRLFRFMIPKITKIQRFSKKMPWESLRRQFLFYKMIKSFTAFFQRKTKLNCENYERINVIVM